MRLNQILLAVTAIALFGLTPVTAQDGQAAPADQRKKQFAEMAAKSGQPTEQHKLLAPFVGHFDQVSAVKMGPGEPITFHAIGTGTWIMGSRFVRLDSTSAPDEEVKGDRMHILGFDPATNKFTFWGIESGSLTSYSATGDYDAASKTFNFDGEREVPGAKIPFHMAFKVEANGVIDQTLTIGPTGTPMLDVHVTHTPTKG